MSLWRIAADTPNYESDDLSGAGAQVTGGRWNKAGTAMVYTSSTRALASLETIVHFNMGGLPLNRYLVEITLSDPVWAAAEVFKPGSAWVGWDAEPAGRVSIGFGTTWARERRSVLLVVPSVIVPEERNVLINPEHPDAESLRGRKVRRWIYDARLKV